VATSSRGSAVIARRPGRVVARAELGGEHALETAMTRLRAELGEPKLVQAVAKRGYRLALDPAAEFGHCLDGDAR